MGDSLFNQFLAASGTDAHQDWASAGQVRFDIGKIDVDQTGNINDIRDTFDTKIQDAIRDEERFFNRHFLVDSLQQAIIVDDNHAVHTLGEFADAIFGDTNAFRTFKSEWARNDANRQGSDFSSDLCDHRRTAGSGSATHACCDEDHVGFLEVFADHFAVLLGAFLTDFWVGSGPESSGEFVAHLDADVGVAAGEHLRVGVGGDEFDSLQAGFNHAVDGVVSCPAKANHSYLRLHALPPLTRNARLLFRDSTAGKTGQAWA